MTDSFESLRRAVKAETRRQRKLRANSTTNSRAQMLGAFIQMRLDKLGRSPEQLARALDVEPDLIEGILSGLLPLSELDDELLTGIARAIKRDANVLRLMAGREPQLAPSATLNGRTSSARG
jgi:hypothetical protein